MELKKIKGNTYYINAPTNIGVYSFKNKNCILVDTGIDSSFARKLGETLIDNNLHPKYIVNTHSHADHCGGNNYFISNYPGCQIFSSDKERLYMETPELLSIMLSSCSPIKGVDRVTRPFKVDYMLEYGINKINDEKFDIVSLKGHSIEQIGIITPEKVCFLGDSMFSKEIIEKYPIPYLFNIEDSLNTLKLIKDIQADFFLLSHSNALLTKDEVTELADFNIKNIQDFKDLILELLDQPLSRENLLQNISILDDVNMDLHHYHLNFSAVSAFIKYLYDYNLIDYSIENGTLYYFKRP